MRRHRRYLHRRTVRFTYLIHLFYGVWEPWWPHRLRDRIEILETQRKYRPDTFFQRIPDGISASVRKRYGTALASGEMSEDAFNRKLSLLKAADDMLHELSIFVDKEWRKDMRSYSPLSFLTRSVWKLNPYLKSVRSNKEKIFNDPVRLKEMVLRMEQEPLMDGRRRILMEYVKDGWNYDIDYRIIWKRDAAYIQMKQQELASRHTVAELQDLESALLAPYIRMSTASLSPIELVFLFAQEAGMEIADAKKLVKFGRFFGYYIVSDEKRYVLADPLILKREHANCNRQVAVSDSVMKLVDAESSGIEQDVLNQPGIAIEKVDIPYRLLSKGSVNLDEQIRRDESGNGEK